MDKMRRRTERKTVAAKNVNTPVRTNMKLFRLRTGQNLGML